MVPKQDSSSSHVTAIYKDQIGKLWVGYQDGSIYFMEQHELKAWQPEEGLPTVPIVDFLLDDNNHFWIATYGEGLYYFDQQRLYNFNTDDGLLADDIYTMTLDPQNRIWVGTDRGISICSWQEGSKQIKNIDRYDGLPDDIVRTIKADEFGNFWIGFYDGGFCYYDFEQETILYDLEDWNFGIVNDLEIVQAKEIWIGTETRGVLKYDFASKKISPVTGLTGLSTSNIHDLHKDQEGNIWGISNVHGIFSTNRQFETLTTPLTKIQALLSDTQACLWIGTEKGLFKYAVGQNSTTAFIPQLLGIELNVLSLFQDKYGVIWIGTFGDGVYCYNPTTGALRHITEKDGLTNGSVLSINGNEKKIWLATLGGVTEFDCEHNVLTNANLTFKNYNHEDGLGTNFIYTVFIDSKQRVWFATDSKGISVLDNGKIKNYAQITYQTTDGDLNSMDLNTVYSITEDQRGHIWFSTAKDGIFEFDGNQFYHLTVKEGIRSLAITSLITAANGQILIVHPSGIDLLNPETRHLIYYGAEVGVKDLDPNLNAFSIDEQGQIWMADQDEILVYTPLKEKLVIHPAMQLTEVSIDYQSIDFDRQFEFGHDQNNVVFKYMGLWYTNPPIVKYRYRLSGYDRDWIESRDQTTTYSNLSPGAYTFEVVSTENEAWSDEPIRTYSFVINPPFWKKAWFILLVMLLGLGIFYWYQKVRDQRIRRLSLLEKEKAVSQLAALKAQINPHFLFNSFNTLIDTIEENPTKAVEYVEKLSDFYRSILKYKDDEVIPLKEEIELVKNFSFILKKRFGNNFKLKLGIERISGFIPPLTLQILVENALKHNVASRACPLTVNIEMDGEKHISVSNNLQPKSHREESTHFGLDGLSRRYDLLGKYKLKIATSKERFSVSVPLIEKPSG